MCYEALSKWHFGEIASCQATMAEAISLATELNDMHALAVALYWSGWLAHFEGDPAGVARLASDLIELSTRQNFAFWLAGGEILRGWARSASGDTAEGISWIDDGIEDWRATGSTLIVPYYLGLKAEALHLADRTSEALEAINEAEALAERFEQRWWRAELHRLRGVFLTAMGVEETKIEASFSAAIRTAREQKSVSLEKRAEGTYAEYRRPKSERVRRTWIPTTSLVNFLQRRAFRSKDKASLTDSFRSPPKHVLGRSPFYQYRSGSGNASPHGHLPLAFSRSTICIQTGSAGPGGEPP
jgi:hypothetical protein